MISSTNNPSTCAIFIAAKFVYLKQITYGTLLDHATVQTSIPLAKNWTFTRLRRYYVTGARRVAATHQCGGQFFGWRS